MHCYTQVASIFTFVSDGFVEQLLLKCLRYSEKAKLHCGTQTTRNIVRHKNSCSAGILYCSQCPNYSTKSQSDMNYHVANKHRTPKPDVTLKFTLCYQEFPGFYALKQHKNNQHGFPIKTAKVDRDDIINEVDDTDL